MPFPVIENPSIGLACFIWVISTLSCIYNNCLYSMTCKFEKVSWGFTVVSETLSHCVQYSGFWNCLQDFLHRSILTLQSNHWYNKRRFIKTSVGAGSNDPDICPLVIYRLGQFITSESWCLYLYASNKKSAS